MTPLLILDLAAKSLAILLLAFAVQSFWRQASAAQRCLVWLATFMALLALPLTLLIEPQWSFAPQEAAQPVPTVHPETRYLLQAVEIPASAPIAQSESLPTSQMTPLQTVGLLWLAGALGVLAYRWLGSWRLRRIRRQSTACKEPRIVDQVTDLAQALSIRCAIDVRTSSDITVPVTWGTLRPLLLLPQEAHTWSDEALSAAVLHELAHIRHRDAAGRWLGTIVCALHWCNPLVWLASRSWRAAQEQAADDLVLRFGAAAQDYALQLLQAARSFREGDLFAAPVLAMARPATLETRLSAIMDANRNRRRAGGKNVCTVLLGFALILAGLSSLSLQGQSAKPQVATSANPVAEDGQQLSIEVKVLEAPTRHFTGNPQIISGKILSQQDADAMGRDPAVKLRSMPRIVTRSRQEVSIESIVNHPLPAGQPPLPIGTKVKLLPSISGERVNLAAEVSISEKIGEDQGLPLVSSRVLNTSVEIPAGQTVLLALSSAERVPDIILQITPIVLAAPPPGLPVVDARDAASKIILPRVQFAGASLDEAIEFLRVKSRTSGVAGAENLNINIGGKAPAAILSLDLKQVPLAEALRYVAGLSNMDLRFDGNSITFVPPGSPQSALQTRSPTPKKATAGTPSQVEQKAASIILPTVQFSEATFDEAVEFLRVKSRQLDSQKNGVNIVAPPGLTTAKLNLDLKNVPLSKALLYVAQLSNLDLRYQDNAAILTKIDNPQVSPPNPAQAAVSRAVAKAKAIIVPSVVFSGASLTEAVEYLRIKGREFAPDKQDVNIIISDASQATKPDITYDLRQTSLLQALQTAATLAGFSVQADDDALLLVPLKK